jgi:shikimate dehydrogenase
MLRRFLNDPPDQPFCAILGDPVSHSLSPRLHNEAFRLIGSGWTYVPIQVLPNELGLLPELFALPTFRGANVTVPHKEAVMSHVHEIDALAAEIGAVNTVVPAHGSILGYNTDMDGFMDPLAPFASRLAGANALVFGSGGAQKAVLFALKRLDMAAVRVVSRTPDPSDPTRIAYDQVAGFADDTTLFVNATPLGLPHLAGQSPLDGLDLRIGSHQIGYDLLYKPRITPFLERFVANQATAIGGMEMFIGQAKRSFELWTGVAMPEEAADVLR